MQAANCPVLFTQLSIPVIFPSISSALLGRSRNVSANFSYLPLLPRSIPDPFPLSCPIVDFRFIGYSNMGQDPGSKGAPLLRRIVMPLQNKTALWEL